MLRRLIIIVSFALVFLLPTIQGVVRLLPDAPLDEKRLPKPRPEWSASHQDLNAYLLGWQGWFNDRYPGRNLLIRLKTQLDYSLFSYSDRIYIGTDGWLFYRSVLDTQITSELLPARGLEVDLCVDNFRKLHDWLQARGVTLVIMENQMKYIFYPDRLPTSAPRLPDFSKGNDLRRRLQSETGAIWIDSTAILETIKPQRNVFFRTDFHWNDPAAFVVAQETVDRLADRFGQPKLGWRLRLEMETKPNSGGEAAFMPLLRPVTEEALFVKPTWQEAPAEVRVNEAPFETIHRLKDRSAPVLPPIVVFGDSFGDGFRRSGFEEHFAAVYWARTFQASLSDVLQHFPPDARFMLVEFIEPISGVFSRPIDFPAPAAGKSSSGSAQR